MISELYRPFELQSSGDVIIRDHEAQHSVDQEEIVQFYDENRGPSSGVPVALPRVDDMSMNTELGNFLKRPVKIASFSWAQTDSVGYTTAIYPWTSFFNSSYIKYKLNNYSFIRCNLKVKVIVNASPFYYGAMILSYAPLPTYSPNKLYDTLNTGCVTAYSQRPHLWIYPQNSEAGEMTLPYINPRKWLRVQKASDFTDMGRLDPLIMVPLRSANGATGTSITVQVYAWAEDVEVSGSSAGLALQGGKDEFDEKGVISGPASAVASAAGRLTDLPYIGKFATAAQVGASAVAKVSSMFGYTNTPVIAPVSGMRPAAFPHLASSEVSFPVEPLALDPKNGVSISPKILGLPDDDPLSISSIASREAVLCAFDWSNTSAVDTILFSTPINPGYFFVTNTAGLSSGLRVWQTPMCMLSQIFKHWRGDVILRFRVVASQYHKGRLRITWDPAGYAGANIINTADTTTVAQTVLLDIGKDSDVSVRIPYNQALPWLKTPQSLGSATAKWSTSASPTFSGLDEYENGTLVARVATNLTAPAATTTVSIIVSVMAADNFEVANPLSTDNTNETYSPFTIQG
jgi:hypothetical protein